jgi:hypothetical protein
MTRHLFAWRAVPDKTSVVEETYESEELDPKKQRKITVEHKLERQVFEKQPPRHELKVIDGDQARYVRDLQAALGDDYAEVARMLERLDAMAE